MNNLTFEFKGYDSLNDLDESELATLMGAMEDLIQEFILERQEKKEEEK